MWDVELRSGKWEVGSGYGGVFSQDMGNTNGSG
jgi:hypothetical protein